jgi:LCP family protein required for cell wall assembly
VSSHKPSRSPRGAPAEPVRHGQLHSKRPWATVAKILVAIIAVAGVGGASIVAIAAWDVARSVKPGIHLEHVPGAAGATGDKVTAIDGEVNLLLAGTDTRTGQGGAFETKDELAGSSGVGKNDVTMLLHISADHSNATVVSFPRDMVIPIPSCTAPDGKTVPATRGAMMNTTLERGDLSCTVRTIETLTGVHIPFAAKITLEGVTAMSNAIGGVTVCLATPVVERYTIPPLNLAAGPQTLEGAEALSFLRSRHGVGDGSDLGRISNQQVFLSALVRKVKSAGVLGNPLALYPLAKAAVTNMQFSDTLTDPTTLVKIGLALKSIDLNHLVFVQYPTVPNPRDVNRVIPDTVNAEAVNLALRTDQPVQLTGKLGEAAVLDPNAPSASPTPTDTPSASPSDGTIASPSPSAPATVTLAPTVTGQTAAEQTCTKGYSRR